MLREETASGRGGDFRNGASPCWRPRRLLVSRLLLPVFLALAVPAPSALAQYVEYKSLPKDARRPEGRAVETKFGTIRTNQKNAFHGDGRTMLRDPFWDTASIDLVIERQAYALVFVEGICGGTDCCPEVSLIVLRKGVPPQVHKSIAKSFRIGFEEKDGVITASAEPSHCGQGTRARIADGTVSFSPFRPDREGVLKDLYGFYGAYCKPDKRCPNADDGIYWRAYRYFDQAGCAMDRFEAVCIESCRSGRKLAYDAFVKALGREAAAGDGGRKAAIRPR